MFLMVASVSMVAVVSIPMSIPTIATIAMVMVPSIVMTISMPMTIITVTIAVMTISMAITTIAIVTIAWRRFQVLDNLHFFVLIFRRHFHKFHTSLDIFWLSILLAL